MKGAAVTEDALLGGKVVLFQPARGFRAGTDSVLLAASLAKLELKGGEIAEFGCGAGGALFPAMWHLDKASFTGVEQAADMVALAARNADLNEVSARLKLVQAGVDAFARDHVNRFDLVFSNPPYFEAGKIAGPATDKQAAYVEGLGLDEWLKAMLFVAKPRARLVLIHRAAELARILTRLDKQAGEITVMPIRPYPEAEANRVLVTARKGLRAGRVRLLAGLGIYKRKDGPHTGRAKAAMIGKSLKWI